jgi:hypothetical protein
MKRGGKTIPHLLIIDEANECYPIVFFVNASRVACFAGITTPVYLANDDRKEKNGRVRITAPPAHFARLLNSFPQFILLVKVNIHLDIQLLVWPDEVRSR